MSNRFLKPKSPYEAPLGFTPGALPLTAVAYDPNDPTTEVIDKGVQFVNPCTKSSFNVPTAYHEPDACGNEYYTKANVASSIQQKQDCGLTAIFQGSLSVTVPRDISKAEFDELCLSLTDALYTSIAAKA